ncbi:MAG TPA: hypothetical protein VNQ73_08740 [Ilumatobacter sp.]|nr:hypothetical protein [Ilumatobacter sp.]
MSTSRARATISVLVLCVAPVAACGGGDDESGGLPTAPELDVGLPGSDVATPDATAPVGNTSGEIRPPEFVLTGTLDPPAGTVLDPANCGRADDSGSPYFDYHIPSDWVVRGGGSGGSGGVTGRGYHTYELPDGTMLEVEVDTEMYLRDEPVDADGVAWTTWDYDITSYDDGGEETERIVYDPLGPVDIDGESFDLWFLDQAQSDVVSRSEYKLRIVFAEVPTGMPADDDRRPESAEVTFSWNATDGEVTEETVRDVLSTFRVAQCAQDGLTELYGMLTGAQFPNVQTPDVGN